MYTAEISRSVCPIVLENFNITDDAPIDIVIESVPVVCSNEPYNLQVIPEGGIWSGIGVTGNGVLTSAELTNGEYTQLYQYSTEQGCIWKDSVIIIVDKLRLSKVIQEGDKICGETPVVLKIDSTDANTTTQWFNIANNEIVGNGSFLNIKIPGTYSAIVSKHECSLETDSFTITAQSDSLYVPNLFTPNSDSFNDQFEIKSDGLEDFNIRIINRYGRPVFEANDPDFKWEADNLPAGVYFWRITYLSCSQRVREHKGWVQISK